MNKTLKIFATFFLILLLLSVGGILLNVLGAIVGTILGILGLIIKLVLSKSVLTLLAVGLLAYFIVNQTQNEKSSHH